MQPLVKNQFETTIIKMRPQLSCPIIKVGNNILLL